MSSSWESLTHYIMHRVEDAKREVLRRGSSCTVDSREGVGEILDHNVLAGDSDFLTYTSNKLCDNVVVSRVLGAGGSSMTACEGLVVDSVDTDSEAKMGDRSSSIKTDSEGRRRKRQAEDVHDGKRCKDSLEFRASHEESFLAEDRV
ncbi:hypothetical protein KC19_VG025900 [Ceratodon purpureus]|uniref:Uncharacterized protein n=1 Tax=Ceratodon purpureus TaxID=3225 RepID=A0A8T0HL90_CERPU|nr:hypothetical protein KC19_VG025900 [Ceratodon purpureus]